MSESGGRAESGGRLASLHPALFAVLPILSAMAANLDTTGPLSMLRPGSISLAATGILWMVSWLYLRDLQLASMWSSFALLWFFSFGHLLGADPHRLVEMDQARTGISNTLLSLAWLTGLIAGFLALKRLRRWRAGLNRAFGTMAVVAVILPIYRITAYELILARADGVNVPRPCLRTGPPTLHGDPLPDIYYIILDGYANREVLQRLYGFDNSAALDYLSRHNFSLAEDSRANYLQTRLSLASSLNMSYLHALAEERQFGLALATWVRHSAVRSYLEDLGYRTVAFATGYRTTEIADADLFLRPGGVTDSIIGLEEVLVDTSALRILIPDAASGGQSPFQPGFAAHRSRVEYMFRVLAMGVPGAASPKFVFAHIVSPHPPFVFGPNGEPPSPPLPYTPHDGDYFPGTPEEYLRGYTEQLAYLNSRLPEFIGGILSNSDRPPIVVLQGDHGPGSRLSWSSMEETDIDERTGILNAYLLPDGGFAGLYPSISPVNTFRLILSRYFGFDCPLLPDRSYFSNWTDPTDFIAITASSPTEGP